MRMDPPPSPPPASGTMPAATAAAEPPLEPPAVRPRSHGLLVGPKASGSVYGSRPNSGRLVLPTNTNPAARKRRTISLSRGCGTSRRIRVPQLVGTPSTAQIRVLEQAAARR